MATPNTEPGSEVLVDGKRVHFLMEGDAGPVVVMLSSLGTSIEMWDRVVEELKPKFRILRIDHPGHGGSESVTSTTIDALAERVVAVLDALGVSMAHIVGLSLGGMIAQVLGLRHAERVMSLTLCATAAILPTAEFWNGRAELVLTQGMGPIVDLSKPRWFTPTFATSPRAQQMLEDVTEVSAEGYAACCRAIGAFDLTDEARDIAAPALLIAGREDPSTTVSMMSDLAGLLTKSEMTIIEDCAHILAVERPEETARAIKEWLAKFLEGPNQAT